MPKNKPTPERRDRVGGGSPMTAAVSLALARLFATSAADNAADNAVIAACAAKAAARAAYLAAFDRYRDELGSTLTITHNGLGQLLRNAQHEGDLYLAARQSGNFDIAAVIAGEAVAKHTTVQLKRGESGVLAAKTALECVQLRMPRR